MANFRVLSIASSINLAKKSNLPKTIRDTEEFSAFCRYVENDFERFVYCEETKSICKADDFFLMNDIDTFST